MSYKSPVQVIEKLSETMLSERKNYIMDTIQYELGVEIDKAELIKALNYDRNQYEKGFKDGYNAGRTMENDGI